MVREAKEGDRQCRECGAPARKKEGFLCPACRCRSQCWVCHTPIPVDAKPRACRTCQETLTRIYAAHEDDEFVAPKAVGRIEQLAERAASGLPLFGEG